MLSTTRAIVRPQVGRSGTKHCLLITGVPSGQKAKVNPLDFGRKLAGMVTGHAPDQLKLAGLLREWKVECDREMRGYRASLSVPTNDLVALVTEENENEKMMERVGGLGVWSRLAPKARDELAGEVLRQCRTVADGLSADRGKSDITLIRKMVSGFRAIVGNLVCPRASMGKGFDSTRFHQADNDFTRFDGTESSLHSHLRHSPGKSTPSSEPSMRPNSGLYSSACLTDSVPPPSRSKFNSGH